MDLDKIGQNLKSLREARGYTQAVLAEKTGLSNVHISHLESGTTAMSLDSLISIAEALCATPDDILVGQYQLTDRKLASHIESKRLSQAKMTLLYQFIDLLAANRLE